MRKVLSFVLVLALVLSSFSMAFADDAATTTTDAAVTAPAETTAPATTATIASALTDIAGLDCEQAVKVLVDLGVLQGYTDGSYKPENTVTRAEAAVIVIKALGLEKSVGTQKSSYTDMAGYGWAEPYIAFASNLGILQGYGDGTYKPGAVVSYNEFAAILVRSLGYTTDSLTGTWPGNYVNKAAGLGIMDDITSGGSNGANRGDVAIMTSNNLTNYIGTIDKDGNFQETVIKGIRGQLGAEYDNYVYRLGGKEYTDVVTDRGGEVINTTPYLGKFCNYFENSDGEIIAVKEVKSTTLDGSYDPEENTFTADDIDYKFDSSLDPEDAGKIKYTPNGETTMNGTAKAFGNAAVDALAALGDSDYVLEVKVSGKTIKEVYSVSTWKVRAALKVVAGDLDDIKDAELLGYDFDTNKDDSIKENSFELIGVASLDDIKADNVVYVYTEGDTNDGDIVRVAVGTQVVEGTISKIKGGTDNEWTINNTVYGFASDEYAPGKFASDKLGDDVKLYLDAYGDIYDYDTTSGTADNYAIVKGAWNDREEIRLYMSDDSSKMFSTDVDDDSATVLSKLDNKSGYLVGYALDKDGVVDTLEAGYTTGKVKITDPTANVVTYSGVLTSNKVLGNYNIDSDVAVFTAVTIAQTGVVSGTFDVTSIANLEKASDNPGNKLFVLYLDKDGKTVLAMVADASLDKGTGTDSYAVVSDVTYATNAVGDKAYELTGFIDGAAMKDVFTDDEATGRSIDGKYDAKINVFKIKYNDDKNITELDENGPASRIGTAATDGGLKATGSATQYISDGYLVLDSSGTATTYAVADNAVVYSVTFDGANVDEYAKYSGSIKVDHQVWLFETDDENDGYDIVIYAK